MTRPVATRESGFSLLQTSIILMMAAMVLISFVPGQGAGDANQKLLDSIAKLNKVEDGMNRFMAVQGRRPCPADASRDVNAANFGVEAGTVTPNSPVGGCTGGSPAANMGPDAGSGLVVAGAIPTKTLGLPDDYAYDAWGRRFTYEVDIRATKASTCYNLHTGGLAVKTRDPTGTVRNTDNVMYAYITHGPGGYGAWPAQGSTLANRVNTGISDADKQNNAGVNAAFLYNTTNFTNTLYAKDRTAQYDDTIYYLDAMKNTCCVGQACNNAAGFAGQGTATNDAVGNALITLDLNGDGLSDIAVCAPNASPGGRTGAGSLYVLFGSRSTFYGTAINLSTLNGSNGVRIDGTNAGDHLCSSLATGDVNGDDINDLIIGTSAYASNTGAVYVVLGGNGAWPSSFTISALVGSGGAGNGTRGWRIDGETTSDKFGSSVASRDFNGDDFDDILIGANGAASSAGAGYLICGGGGPWAASMSISGLAGMPGPVPTCGIKLRNNSGLPDKFGSSAAMGNINGDNYADAIMGAPYAQVGVRPEAGKTYAICGGNGTYTTPIDINTLTGIPGAPGSCGTVFTGVATQHHSGTALEVSDMNGDGIMDVVIGAPNANPMGRVNAGSTYVVYGKVSGFGATFDLNTVNYNTTGFRIDGLAGDQSGTSLHGHCDVNGDGIPDLIIGAPYKSPAARTYAGGGYLIFGAATSISTLDVGLFDGSQGVALFGAVAGDHAGMSVASGDAYNFGICNVLVGAPDAQVGANTGAGSIFTVLGQHSWKGTFDLSTVR